MPTFSSDNYLTTTNKNTAGASTSLLTIDNNINGFLSNNNLKLNSNTLTPQTSEIMLARENMELKNKQEENLRIIKKN
jgi:hypothetical protein